MEDRDWPAKQFEHYRPHLKAVSYRMLGSHAEADDAVQDAWIRFSRSGADGVENLGGWLTTIVARVCLNLLRSRAVRREDPVGVHIPDPIISRDEVADPQDEALTADMVGLAMIVVLDTLAPAERLAFVLHDMFDLPFEEIAPMVGRSPVAARQLASRARRRVRGMDVPAPTSDLAAQRRVVDAFFAAARGGDFAGLLSVLDPEAVLRADGGTARPEASTLLRGAESVARRALMFNPPAAVVTPVLVNGAAGAVITREGRPISVMGFIVAGDKIVEIDIIVDPVRLDQFDLAVHDDPTTRPDR